MHLLTLTLKEYFELNSKDRQDVDCLLRRALTLLVEDPFNYYMRYDQTTEYGNHGGMIPIGMLVNAILYLSDRFPELPSSFVASWMKISPPKSTEYYREYYGGKDGIAGKAFIRMFQYMLDHYACLVEILDLKRQQRDHIYRPDLHFIYALVHCVWWNVIHARL